MRFREMRLSCARERVSEEKRGKDVYINPHTGGTGQLPRGQWTGHGAGTPDGAPTGSRNGGNTTGTGRARRRQPQRPPRGVWLLLGHADTGALAMDYVDIYMDNRRDNQNAFTGDRPAGSRVYYGALHPTGSLRVSGARRLPDSLSQCGAHNRTGSRAHTGALNINGSRPPVWTPPV